MLKLFPKTKTTHKRNKPLTRSVQRTLEALESRLMMSTDYLLNGNQLTQIINGTSQTPTTVANINNVQITGTGSDNITIENFTGHATVNGGGGGDTITLYAGSGGSVNVIDSSAVTPDQLIVRAPTTSAANFTASASALSLSSGDAISYGTGIGSVSMVGQLFSNGDSLTVNGSGGNTISVGSASVSLGGSAPTLYYSTFNGITVNGGASDNFTLSGDSIATTLNAGSGSDTFNITTNSVALNLNGGSGNDTYTINSNSGLLTATGGTGNSAFTVYGSSSSMTLNGGAGTNSFTTQSNSATLNINGGGTANTVTINGNSSTLTAHGGTGSTDSYTVNATTGQVTFAGGTGISTYLISAPTIAAVTVTGSTTGAGTLTFDGTTLNNAFSVTSNSISAGSGAAVGFTHLTGLVVNGIGGNDSFLVSGDSTATTLVGGTGNDTFNLQSTSATLAINTGSGASTVNLGSNAPLSTNNTVAGLAGAITVTGDGSDTLNYNDNADTTARSGTLSSTALTGLGTGGMNYSGLASLNVKLGSGGNALAITGNASGTVTNYNAGGGANAIYLGSTNAISLGGVMDNYAGTLNLTGSGNDSLLIDDSGNTNTKTVSLTPTHVTGISPAVINYTGLSAMVVDLGTAGNSLTVTNTASTTATTINGGSGNDTFTINADSAALQVNTRGGNDVVNVQTIGAVTGITSTGHSQINLGSTAPAAGGVLAGLTAGLTVTGAGSDTLTADDSGDALTSTGTLSGTAIHGLGLASAGITYSGLSTLNLNLGTAANTLTVTNTATATATHITGGAAADTITLDADSSVTTITGGAGNDQINVQAISYATSIVTGSGTDVVNVGSNAPATPSATASVAATLTVTGGGNTLLNLDDTGDNTARTPTLSATTLTGITGGSGVLYSGLSGLTVSLGSGGNGVLVNNTASTASTTINAGSGNDTVNVLATSGITHINDGTGINTVNVGSTGSTTGSLTTSINGALTLTGNTAGASDTLNLFDAADTLPRVVTLSPTSLTGASPAGISMGGFALTHLALGTANNSLTVTDTNAGTTLIDAGSGSNSITIDHTSGPTTLNAGSSTVALQSAAATTVIHSTASNQITIGNPVNSGRTLTGITAAVQLTGNSGSSALVDDSADAVARISSITGGVITGLSSGEIDYTGLNHLNVNLGGGGNTLTMADTTSTTPTTLTGGAGNDTFNIRSDSAALSVLPAGGANTVNIANNGVLTGLFSQVTLTSTATDTLNVNDTTDVVTRGSVGLAATSITGLGGAAINYTGATNVNLSLGNAPDTLNITGTATVTHTAVHTGTTGSTVNVRATTGPLAIVSGAADAVNVGSNGASAGLVNTINGDVTVTGNDTLNITDNADTTDAAATLTPTRVSGLGASGVINYSGLSHLTLFLGLGNDAVNVNGTSAGHTAIVSGGGSNTISVNASSAPLAIISGGSVQIGSGSVTGITGPVALTGDGNDQLIVSDIADINSNSGTLSATQLTLGPAVVSYSGAGNIAISLGSGGDAFTINGTPSTTPVSLVGGSGADQLSITGISSATVIQPGSNTATVSVGNSLSALAAPLTISGIGSNTLNVDDTASTLVKTGTLTTTALTGLGTDGISYSGIGQLNLLLGSGGNTFNITSDSTPTTLTAGSDDDQISIQSFNVPLTLHGGATAALTLDDSADTSTEVVQLTGSSVIGLGTSAVTYDQLASMNLLLGTGHDSLIVNGTSAGMTTVTGNTAGQNFTVNPTAMQGPLTLTGNGSDPLRVDDTAESAGKTVTLASGQITGLGGAISYTGMDTLGVDLGSGNDIASITGLDPAVPVNLDGGNGNNTANIDLSGDLAGSLTLTRFGAGSVDVEGNFTGSLVTDGNLSTVHVHGDFTPTAALNVAGVLDQIQVDGSDSGQLTVGSLEGVVESAVTPSADGTIFSLTQQGITRSIHIQSDNLSALGATTFSVVYDSTTGVPQAAVRVNGGTSGQRFDVSLDTPQSSVFSLSRLDSSSDAATAVRNVAVDGSILNSVTPAQAAYFGYAANTPGGVQLPADALAAVGARDAISAGSIRATSIQGIAFNNLIGYHGLVHQGVQIPIADYKGKVLLATLAVNPVTRKPYATVLPPTEPLLAPAGPLSAKTTLFPGMIGSRSFDPNGLLLWNRDSDDEVTADVTFSGHRINGEETVNLLAFTGSGGSVQTRHVVSNITSTGALGDIVLTAGPAEQLAGITAPSIEGNINLHGGKLIGTIQTTAQVGADIGQADGSTTITLQMGPNAQIVSRGTLFSDVQITGNLTGTIAAGGDMDGSLRVTGKGRSSGNVIAFGAIRGAVAIAGSFSGDLAAGGSDGISGNVTVGKGIVRGGVVESAGEIGDATAGTRLKTSSVTGIVAAVGPEMLQLPPGAKPGHQVEAINPAVLAGLWMGQEQPLEIDQSPGDLAGLQQVKARLKGLSG